MIKEPTSQPIPLSPSDGDEPTEPRIPVQRLLTRAMERVLQTRHYGALTVSIDEQGIVTLLVPGQEALILKPEETFDLLDFLFEYRNLLAARSAEIAELQGETHKECKHVK